MIATILEDDEDDGEVIETTTKFEFNLGFAEVSKRKICVVTATRAE